MNYKYEQKKRFLIDTAILEKVPKEIILWCEQHSVLKNQNMNEFEFWIPPYNNHSEYLSKTYGDNIPNEIFDLLICAIKENAEELDTGYLRICFLEN